MKYEEELLLLRKERAETFSSCKKKLKIIQQQFINDSNLILRLQKKIQQSDNQLFKFHLSWASTRNKSNVFLRGPYIKFLSKALCADQWEDIHISSINKYSRKLLEKKIGYPRILDVNKEQVDDLEELLLHFPKVLKIKKLVEIAAKHYRFSIIDNRLDNCTTWENVFNRIMNVLSILEQKLDSDLIMLESYEADIDKYVVEFNSIMRRRYRKLYFKWDIAPRKKLKPYGPGNVAPYIIIRLVADVAYSKTVYYFKRKTYYPDSHKHNIHPWITNKVLRDSRITRFRRKIFNKQRQIISMNEHWDIYYRRSITILSSLQNIT